MNTVPAKELKRRGVAAIEELLDEGPVEIIKNNRPACVVLSIDQYRELARHERTRAVRKMKVSELFSLPPAGKRKRREIDAELRAERESWGER